MKTITVRINIPWSSYVAGNAASLVLHGTVLLLISLTLRGCPRAGSGDAGGEPFRDVGLFLVDGVDGGLADAGIAPGAGDAEVTLTSSDPVGEVSPSATENSNPSFARVPTVAPDIDTLLNPGDYDSKNGDGAAYSTLPSLIGPGDPIGGLQRPKRGGGSQAKSSVAGGAGRSGGRGGSGSTTFMDIEGVGKSFAYVIDTSSSMQGTRLKFAQGQLKASLRILQPNQKFAVVFYNDYRERLRLRRQAEQDMYFATDVNRELAAHEIDRITCDNGTSHLPAILEALSLQPDVLYLLTDGEPELFAADLAEIVRVKGNTTIHAIRIGDGTISSRTTGWMEQLALQSGGEFREVDRAQ